MMWPERCQYDWYAASFRASWTMSIQVRRGSKRVPQLARPRPTYVRAVRWILWPDCKMSTTMFRTHQLVKSLEIVQFP